MKIPDQTADGTQFDFVHRATGAQLAYVGTKKGDLWTVEWTDEDDEMPAEWPTYHTSDVIQYIAQGDWIVSAVRVPVVKAGPPVTLLSLIWEHDLSIQTRRGELWVTNGWQTAIFQEDDSLDYVVAKVEKLFAKA